MAILFVTLGDQLSHSLLTRANKKTDHILLCEVWDEATYVRHHKKKIAFLFSAMRHFAEELRQQGYQVHYTKLDDPNNTGSFTGEVTRLCQKVTIEKIITTFPGEYRVLDEINQWESALSIPVEIQSDSRFLSSPEEFADWVKDRKQLRMEFFYREMRRKHNILMEAGEPTGGKWNFDSSNRKSAPKTLSVPAPFNQEPDDITRTVLELVQSRFPDHFGDIEPFYFAVTRKQAIAALEHFIQHRLPFFGDYQDAMVENEPWMFHSHLSFYLNCGLLLPAECIEQAEQAYLSGDAPINAVEGFVRQILGWREYVRGIYWLKMPEYKAENFFAATRKLPEFYWTAQTKMNCLKQTVSETKQNAYAHHIQRLMVLGNFALLAGIDPSYVNEWFLIVYADAYEWVELPNVSGMILFADGGYLASKPYAAGGSYINKMSSYCKNCHYSVTKKNGEEACPFNYLYWDFLERNQPLLANNHRLSMIYRTFERMSEEKKALIKADSQRFLEELDAGELV